MKREDEWGEDTSRSRKMGGVYLGEGKIGGSILKRRKKWGEYTKVKKKMGVFLAPSLKLLFLLFIY